MIQVIGNLFGRILLFLALPALAVTPYGAIDEVAAPPVAKNIILMIDDGSGYYHVNATSMYQYGTGGAEIYQRFPVKLAVSTYPSNGSYDPSEAWSVFDYVTSGWTDSGTAATAMASGVKTLNYRLGVDANGSPVKSVFDLAEDLGKSTGVVTSVDLSDATPAGFVVHNSSRYDYESIAKDMIMSSRTDVIMGAGNPWFDDNGKRLITANSYQYVGGQSTWDGLVAGTLQVADSDGDGASDPWTLIQSPAQFRALVTGPTPERVIGVPRVYTTLQQARDGNKLAAPGVVPKNTNVPTLAQMTKGALNVLDNNKNGFLLMVEGGAADLASHEHESGRMIEEEMSFSQAAQAVVNWVNKHSSWSKTLLIVTADHECGYLTGPGSNPTWKPLVNCGAGKMPGMQWNASTNTNCLVPLFAKGQGASLLTGFADQTDPRRGRYIDNTDIGKVLFEVLQ